MKRILLFLLLLVSIESIGQIAISALPTHVGDASTAYVPIVISGQTRKATGNQLAWKKIDSLRVSNDSLYSYKNGTKTLVHVLSSSQNLQQTTTFGNTTTDTIYTNGLGTILILPPASVDPDFTIVVHPDLQYQTLTYPAVLKTMFDWLVTNEVSENIKAVIGVGDMTQNATVIEWDTVDHQFDRLDAAGIPYVTVPGNHDYASANPLGRNSTLYNTYFGQSRWSADYTAGVRGNYGGKAENNWYKFDVGSKKYLVLGLEFLAPDSVYTWADGVLDSFYTAEPDRSVMMTTHAYITAWGEITRDTSSGGTGSYGLTGDNNGNDMWEELVRNHANVKWVFSGHHRTGSGQTTPNVYRYTDVGTKGNVIHQILVNYQQDAPSGGNGYFMRLKFKPSLDEVEVSFYSEHLAQFDSRFPAYTIDMTPLRIDNTVGVGGSLYVNSETRLDGDVFLKGLKKGSIPFAMENGKIISNDSFNVNFTNGRVGFGTGSYLSNRAKVSIQQDNVGITSDADTLTTLYLYNPVHATAILNQNSPAIYFSGNAWMTNSGGSNKQTLMRIYNRAVTGASDGQTEFAVEMREAVAAVWRQPFSVNALGTVSAKARTNTSTYQWVSSTGVVEGSIFYQHNFARFQMSGASLSFNTTAGGNGLNVYPVGVGSLTHTFAFTNLSARTNTADFTAGDPSAVLEGRSDNKGFLPPRMTAANRQAIVSPATGLMVFDTDSARYFQYKAGAWFGIRYTNESEISSAGTYTPTLTNTTNVTSSTAYDLQYSRVGNTVTVSGKFDVTATADETQTELGLSLPFASAMTTNGQAGGTGAMMNGSDAESRVVVIYSDATNDRATFRFLTPIDSSPLTIHFSFTYQIL